MNSERKPQIYLAVGVATALVVGGVVIYNGIQHMNQKSKDNQKKMEMHAQQKKVCAYLFKK